MLDIIQIEVGLLSNFCEVIGCTESGRAALVDPAFEVDVLLAAAAERQWVVDAIFLTHTHLDHIDGLAEAHQATSATVRCHPREVETAARHVPRDAIRPVVHEETFHLGSSPVVALHTPGHTRGSVCFHLPQEAALIAGDVVFVGSVGRTDLPGGDPEAMRHTLHQVIAALPGETKIYPGHDYGKSPTTTLEWELATNPAFFD